MANASDHRGEFASPGIEGPGGGYAGMTLRDYFAAQTIVALHIIAANRPTALGSPDHIADLAYTMADAMLKAREAK